MTKKFIRDEWKERSLENYREELDVVSPKFLDLFQSFEDRIKKLEEKDKFFEENSISNEEFIEKAVESVTSRLATQKIIDDIVDPLRKNAWGTRPRPNKDTVFAKYMDVFDKVIENLKEDTSIITVPFNEDALDKEIEIEKENGSTRTSTLRKENDAYNQTLSSFSYLDMCENIEKYWEKIDNNPNQLYWNKKWGILYASPYTILVYYKLHDLASPCFILCNPLHHLKNETIFNQDFVSRLSGLEITLGEFNQVLKEFQKKKETFTIEQKKHICSAIEKWNYLHPTWAIGYGVVLEKLKYMICDSKIGEFLDDN